MPEEWEDEQGHHSFDHETGVETIINPVTGAVSTINHYEGGNLAADAVVGGLVAEGVEELIDDDDDDFGIKDKLKEKAKEKLKEKLNKDQIKDSEKNNDAGDSGEAAGDGGELGETGDLGELGEGTGELGGEALETAEFGGEALGTAELGGEALEGLEVLGEAEATAATAGQGAVAVAGETATGGILAPIIGGCLIAIAVFLGIAAIIFIGIMIVDPDVSSAGELPSDSKTVVVVDPGHVSELDSSSTQKEYDQDQASWEKNQSGANGGTASKDGKVLERDINQKVANLLTKELQDRGYEVFETKDAADKFMSNRARGKFAKDKEANILIKVHNDGVGPDPGMIFYTSNKTVIKQKWDKKNEAGEYPWRREDATIAEDEKLGKALNKAFKEGQSKYNLKYSNGKNYPTQTIPHPGNNGFGYTYDIPTALLEMSSMHLANDLNFIKDSKNQENIVKAFADGIEAYKPPTSSDLSNLLTPPGMDGPIKDKYYLLPKSSEGLYTLYGSGDTKCNHWGSETLVKATYTVAKAHAAKYPKNKLAIGDLNSSGHDTHNIGIDVDIDIPGGMMNQSPYDRNIAIESAKMWFRTGLVRTILYNDSDVNSAVNEWAKKEGLPGTMKPYTGHDNHFHVRIELEYARDEYVPSC